MYKKRNTTKAEWLLQIIPMLKAVVKRVLLYLLKPWYTGNQSSSKNIFSNQLKKKYFTLVELTVSLGVFSILVLISSIIFTTAQRAWNESSQIKTSYENARVALDIISSDLKCLKPNYGNNNQPTPFWFKKQEGTNVYSNQLINFISKTSFGRPNNSDNLCEIKYQLYYSSDLTDDDAGWIMRSCTASGNTKYNFYENNSMNYSAGLTGADNAFTANNDSNLWPQKLIPYVTELSFQCFDSEGSEIQPITSTTNPTSLAIPFSVNVTLKIMNKNSWDKWITMSGNEAESFRIKHEYVFRKNILIGE